jgi:hypothetical protein
MIRKLLVEAVPAAQKTWAKGTTYRGMLEIIQEIREHWTNRFGYDNYTQLPLACAFLLAKAGDARSAEIELEYYLKLHAFRLRNDTLPKLRKLVADAATA